MAKSKKSRAMTTATGVAALQTAYYDRAMLANLKANMSFSHSFWGCACGQPATHDEVVTTKVSRVFKRRKHSRNFPLCDACFFRYQVMKAAGRLKEFITAYDEQRKNTENEPIDVLRRRPLPAPSGKKIQMFSYKPVGKP